MEMEKEKEYAAAWLQLLEIMERLRAEDGCPWDRAQTHESLKRYMIEETYESLEAIDSGKPEKMAEELGDLLLQVVFHAQLGREAGTFDIGDVLEAVNAKMIRRHPHVFGKETAATPAAVMEKWDAIKQREGKSKREMFHVPAGLPALLRAQKVQEKAARQGFDWDSAEGAWDKITEELAELREASAEHRREELGDLLFAVVNLARFLDCDAEDALSAANDKFVRRYLRARELAEAAGADWGSLDLAKMDAFWEAVKAEERAFVSCE